MRYLLRRLTLACLANVLLAQAPVPLPAQGLARAKVGTSSAHRNCAACHKGHKGTMGGNLAKPTRPGRGGGDQLCLACHEGLNAIPTADGAPKLPAWSGQGSGHLKNRFGSGRAETYSRSVRSRTRNLRLAQDCSGCHDPHGKERGRLRATAFDARGQLLDRRPVSVAEVCFGCHAGPEAAPLPSGNPDVGSLFAKGAASSHAIGSTAAGRPELPSLRTSAFQGGLDCGSCHDNPDPAGPRGPHVSPNTSLLKASFGREKDLARLGDRVNDLCFLCHDRQSIISNQSFPFHAQHLSGFTNSGSGSTRRRASGFSEAAGVLGIRSPKDFGPGRGGAYMPGYGEITVCATCHVSHGSIRQAALIEFDRSVVTASSVGAASFQRAGLGHGTCTLTCHGYDHVQTRY